MLAGIGFLVVPHMWSLIADFNLGTDPSGGLGGLGLLAVVVLMAYLAAIFLGVLVATAFGYFEAYILDSWQARKLGLMDSRFREQWDRYIDSLEKAHNSYVTKQVTAFMFQGRTALALLILAICVFAAPITLPSMWWQWLPPVGILVVAAFLFKAASDDHHSLAQYRMRRFAQPEPPPIYYIAEVDVTNDDGYVNEYVPLVHASIKAFGGRLLAVGGPAVTKMTSIEGPAPNGRVAAQVWDSMVGSLMCIGRVRRQ